MRASHNVSVRDRLAKAPPAAVPVRADRAEAPTSAR